MASNCSQINCSLRDASLPITAIILLKARSSREKLFTDDRLNYVFQNILLVFNVLCAFNPVFLDLTSRTLPVRVITQSAVYHRSTHL